MKNVRKHKSIKLVTTEERRNYLVSEPNCHKTNFFSENVLIIELKKSIYVGLSILEISKTVMHEFWHDNVKPAYGHKAKLWYIDTDSFSVYIKTEDIYVYIAKDVYTRFDT